MDAQRTASDAGLVGATLEGRYRVDAPLAVGGMSSVYRGVDTRLDRPVAIKVMEQNFAGDRSFIDRFELEARAAARLHHPGVVAVLDQGVDAGRVFLVMELIDGGTLRDLIREQGALSMPIACAVLEPVLSALAAAHRAGLVHRDIKPENVLIGQDGTVKVGDFGLVRAIASAGITSDSTILGTVAYLSPEQVTTGSADQRSDVYAAGVMFYEMLTGSPPYQGDTPISVAYRHANDDVPPPSERTPEIPPALDDLVLRATRRDPAMRPPDAAAFLDELTEIKTGLGVPATAVPVPTPRLDGPAHARHTGEVDTEETTTAVERPTDTDASTTVRTAPAAATPIGPQGTRAWSREELQGLEAAPPAPVSPYERQRVRGRRKSMIWLAIVLVLAALVGTTAWWLGSGRWTAVPRVGGLDPVSAEHALQNADLKAQLKQQHDNSVAAGTVIGTDPAAGARALRGATIALLVSEGKPVVPDVTAGATPDAAEQAIRAEQLQPRLDPTQNTYDPTVPAGAVVRLDPSAGTPLNINSVVTVILSNGPPPQPVPNVVGQPHDQAFATLRAAGFQPFDEPAQFSDQAPAGAVIATDPVAGTTIQAGGSVRVGVVVSNAVTVPNVTGMNINQAAATLQKLGLRAQVEQFFGGGNTVQGQSPQPGSYVQQGSTVVLETWF